VRPTKANDPRRAAHAHDDVAAGALADLPSLVTIHEAARALRVSTKTIRRLVAGRRLQGAHLGALGNGRVLITKQSMIDYLAGALD
jgi:excisionase family DNA binding protein